MFNLKMRRAIQKIANLEPANRAAFRSPEFYRLDPGITSRETALYSDAGKEMFNRPNLDEAKALLKEAGYQGAPVVWMTNKESQANYDLALTFKGQLEAAGMTVDLQVMDSATLRARREKRSCGMRSSPATLPSFIRSCMCSSTPGGPAGGRTRRKTSLWTPSCPRRIRRRRTAWLRTCSV
jgi:ABC-type transport system substrate-binding protein